jgi:predicted transcriptional regulator
MPETIEKSQAVNVTVKLNKSGRNSFKSLVLAKQRTPHFLMKEAITRYIEDEEAEQAVIAVAALEHCQKTCLHTTLDELKDWACVVRKDRGVEMPACHT